MPNFPVMYRRLMGAQTDAIEGLQAITQKLIETHRQMEELVMSEPDANIVVLNHNEPDDPDGPDGSRD